MFDLLIYVWGLVAILIVAVLAWLISLAKNDVSFVDVLWAPFFMLAAFVYALTAEQMGTRTVLILILVSAWALRLASYIAWRNWGEGEDKRYQQIRANNDPGFSFKSLYIVFGLQGILAWIISLPLLAAILSSAVWHWLDGVGILLWLIGMTFEAGGDWQLAKFKGEPNNKGKVMDKGLWRYTRHPNYFGNFCIWWGFYLLALSAGGWWSIISPILMSLLLLKVSGVALLEKDIGDRRPDYADYIRRTNAFFPGPTKVS